MALDQAYFDAIHIDVVKKKYYNANKVEAVLSDIRRQALALQAENDRLQRQYELLSGRKDEIGDALVSAKTIAQQILQEAQEQAGQILAQAEKRREEIENVSREDQQGAVRQVENIYSRLRERLSACMEGVNADWQAFLCGLDEEAERPAPAAPEPESPTPAAPEPDWKPDADLELDWEPELMTGPPADLQAKVDAIARELFADL